jgi:hypothetical protein
MDAPNFFFVRLVNKATKGMKYLFIVQVRTTAYVFHHASHLLLSYKPKNTESFATAPTSHANERGYNKKSSDMKTATGKHATQLYGHEKPAYIYS